MGNNSNEVDLGIEIPQWHIMYIVHFLVSIKPLAGTYIISSECFLSNMSLIKPDTLIDELDKA